VEKAQFGVIQAEAATGDSKKYRGQHCASGQAQGGVRRIDLEKYIKGEMLQGQRKRAN